MSVYYLCAKEFGWTQETVDKQSVSYLRGLFYIHQKVNEKSFTPPPIPKKFK